MAYYITLLSIKARSGILDEGFRSQPPNIRNLFGAKVLKLVENYLKPPSCLDTQEVN